MCIYCVIYIWCNTCFHVRVWVYVLHCTHMEFGRQPSLSGTRPLMVHPCMGHTSWPLNLWEFSLLHLPCSHRRWIIDTCYSTGFLCGLWQSKSKLCGLSGMAIPNASKPTDQQATVTLPWCGAEYLCLLCRDHSTNVHHYLLWTESFLLLLTLCPMSAVPVGTGIALQPHPPPRTTGLYTYLPWFLGTVQNKHPWEGTWICGL